MTDIFDRRQIIAAGLATGLLPGLAHATGRSINVTALGQTVLRGDLSAQPYDGFSALAAHLSQADVVMTQLEMALTGPQAGAAVRGDQYDHTTSPDMLKTLKALSVNLVALAGNHAYDLGTGGILSTLSAFEAAKLSHAGIGRDLDDAVRAGVLPTHGGRVALVSMATGKVHPGGSAMPDRPGVNEIRASDTGQLNESDAALNLAAIKKASRAADLVIACHHNHILPADPNLPPPWLEAWARRCIDHGAHAYVGHGYPALQGIEIYRCRPILYNLSSLFFQTATEAGHYKSETWQSVMAEMRFARGHLTSLNLVPLVLNERPDDIAAPLLSRGRPRLATGRLAAGILDGLAAFSAPYGTKLRYDGDQASLIL